MVELSSARRSLRRLDRLRRKLRQCAVLLEGDLEDKTRVKAPYMVFVFRSVISQVVSV